MTWNDLVARTVALVNRSDMLADRVEPIVAQAHFNLQRSRDWECQKKDGVAVVLTANVGPLPTGFKAIRAARLTKTVNGEKQTEDLYPASDSMFEEWKRFRPSNCFLYVSTAEMNPLIQSNGYVVPSEWLNRYAVSGGNLVLLNAPQPDVGVEIDDIEFLATPAGTGTDWFVTNAFDVLLYGAAILALAEVGESASGQADYGTLLTIALADVQRLDRGAQATSQSVYTPPPRGGMRRRWR